MRKILLLSVLMNFYLFALSQTNIFPLNGNVGIGTNSPASWFGTSPLLHINGSRPTISFTPVEVNGLATIQWKGLSNASEFHLNFVDGETSKLAFSSYQHEGGVLPVLFLNGNGNVGIGTDQPACKLSVSGDIILSDSFSRTLSFGNIALLQSSFDAYGSLNFRLHNGNGFSNVMKISGNGEYNLDVSGKIRANEIVVNTEGADFVFDSEYNLPNLTEVEEYIEENKHLPGVPSAEIMKEGGMSMSEMQTKLLQKIEELTLYIIELKKENIIQSEEIGKLSKSK